MPEGVAFVICCFIVVLSLLDSIRFSVDLFVTCVDFTEKPESRVHSFLK